MAEQFKTMKLCDYPGENVDDYCLKANGLLTQLENEGQLPPNHLLTIVDAMIECTVLSFRVQWMARHKGVTDFI